MQLYANFGLTDREAMYSFIQKTMQYLLDTTVRRPILPAEL